MKIIIDIDEGIAQGIIDGENDAPRTIVRDFQATIADAIKNGTPLPEQQLCEDCISREAVMSALFDLWEPTEYKDEDEFLEYLENSIKRLPSVTAKAESIEGSESE